MDAEADHETAERLLVRRAREVCLEMVAGEVSPYEGAQRIAAMCRGVSIHPPLTLHTFVYADSEWDERPEDGGIFGEGVMAAAHELAAAHLD